MVQSLLIYNQLLMNIRKDWLMREISQGLGKTRDKESLMMSQERMSAKGLLQLHKIKEKRSSQKLYTKLPKSLNLSLQREKRQKLRVLT